jgi:hypothetical protein
VIVMHATQDTVETVMGILGMHPCEPQRRALFALDLTTPLHFMQRRTLLRL